MVQGVVGIAFVAVPLIGHLGFLRAFLHRGRLVGDPAFQAEVSKVLGADTKVLGIVMIAFSVIVFASRMRSIVYLQ